MRSPLRISLGLVAALGVASVSASPAMAQLQSKPFEERLYFPTADSNMARPLRLTIDIIVEGKLVTRTVDVTTIKKWTPPKRMMGESAPDYLKDLTTAAAAASLAKAIEIQKAINTAFAAEFAKLGQTATRDTYSQTFAYKNILTQDAIRKATKADGDILHPVQAADMSMVVIPSVRLSADLKKDRPVRSTDFATGENGDGGRYRDLGTSTTSTGVQGFLGVLVPGVPSFATGFDALGDGSLVSLGIDGLFVASVTPTPGESDVNVLDALTLELDENGIPATFDPVLGEVSLNTALLGDQAFFWGNDDPGLTFTVSFGGGVVPEPGSLLLLGAGLTLCACVAWRRKLTELQPAVTR
jgi:hypothetical protein